MNKLKRPPNGRPDNRFLERGTLERELVRKDKQALITDCLKIFDVNTLMFEQSETAKQHIAVLESTILAREMEIERLKARSFWAIINERLEVRIKKIRQRRETNYPTP